MQDRHVPGFRVEQQIIRDLQVALVLLAVVLVVLPLAPSGDVFQHQDRQDGLNGRCVAAVSVDRFGVYEHHVVRHDAERLVRVLPGSDVLDHQLTEDLELGPNGSNQCEAANRDISLSGLFDRLHEMLQGQGAAILARISLVEPLQTGGTQCDDW